METESALLPRQLVEEGPVVDGPHGVLLQEPVLVLGEIVQHLPLRLGRNPAPSRIGATTGTGQEQRQ